MLAKNDSTGLWTKKMMYKDYRPLNLVTPEDKYPMPIPEKLFDSIRDSNTFTIMDLKQSFNQIVLTTKECRKMTFHGSNKLWEWACDAFWIEECTCPFSTSHGLGSRKGKFPEVLQR
jgi:hypothetical protein